MHKRNSSTSFIEICYDMTELVDEQVWWNIETVKTQASRVCEENKEEKKKKKKTTAR